MKTYKILVITGCALSLMAPFLETAPEKGTAVGLAFLVFIFALLFKGICDE